MTLFSRILFAVAMIGFAVVFGILVLAPALAQGHRQSVEDWFGSLKMPGTTTSCCDISDGFRTDARIGPDGWEAKNRRGDWIKIPESRIVRSPTNPTGSAVLFMPTTSDTVIYCFVPPIEA